MSKYQLCNFSTDNTNMVLFVLKKKWFEKIESGEKTIEFREVKKFWNNRLLSEGAELEKCDVGYIVKGHPKKCVMTLGYSNNKLYADIEKIEIWVKKENNLGINPVYAIFLKKVRRTE